MYNMRCLGTETDVHDCQYERQSTGNCSGIVNVNCGKKSCMWTKWKAENLFMKKIDQIDTTGINKRLKNKRF